MYMGKYGSLSKFHLILKKLDSVHTIDSAFFYSDIITRSFMLSYILWTKLVEEIYL